MSDPAMKQALSPDDVAYYLTTADFEARVSQTPGLTPLSSIERILALVIPTILGWLFYIHVEVAPFLPIDIPPNLLGLVKLISFFFLASGTFVIIFVLGSILLLGARYLLENLFPPQPLVTCHKCGKRNNLRMYIESGKCEHCGSDMVYCGKCGQPSSFEEFRSGTGCINCGFAKPAIKFKS